MYTHPTPTPTRRRAPTLNPQPSTLNRPALCPNCHCREPRKLDAFDAAQYEKHPNQTQDYCDTCWKAYRLIGTSVAEFNQQVKVATVDVLKIAFALERAGSDRLSVRAAIDSRLRAIARERARLGRQPAQA